MRMSQLFSQTLRDAPADVDVVSHQLLIRAGFARPLAAGIFSYMPLGQRVIQKVNAILREEINAIGGQELSMPVVHPATLWQASNRWYEIGDEMGRFQDKNGRDMALAMTHEEVVADLARQEIHSYRQLPQLIYHLQTKWRDDPRPRAGMIRAREFTMLDSYSLDADEEGLDAQYHAHFRAYFRIFGRCDLPAIAVESDVGMMGGKLAHEYMYLTPIGEDTLLICAHCGFKANRQIAPFRKPAAAAEEPLPLERVATPDTRTIADLAAYLRIDKSRTAKAVFIMATIMNGQERAERLVFAVVRGDMELNETKLANAIDAKALRPAQEAEILAVGAIPGYASPIGLRDVLVVVDGAAAGSPNLVAGANEIGYHLRNVNYGRDYRADIIADLAAAEKGAGCLNCGEPLSASRGVEVGNIFKLGVHFSEALGANYVDEDGRSRPIVMGSYGIGVGRLIACIAERHHDDHGLIWPATVAPFDVQLVALRGGFEEAAHLYDELRRAGLDVLFDDRDASPGVKFNDADLIGAPVRLTVGQRSLAQGGVELKLRHEDERTLVAVDQAAAESRARLAQLVAAINERVHVPPYRQ